MILVEESRTRGYSLQVGGGDPAQDVVISCMDYHFVLILTEVLDRVAMTGVAVKGQNREFRKKFTSQYILREGGVGCIGVDGSESAVMRHTYLFDSLLYKLVKQTNSSTFFRK